MEKSVIGAEELNALKKKYDFPIVVLFAIAIRTIGERASLLLFSVFSRYNVFGLSNIFNQIQYCTHMSVVFFILFVMFFAFFFFHLHLSKLFSQKYVVIFWITLIVVTLAIVARHYIVLASFDYSPEEFMIIRSSICY